MANNSGTKPTLWKKIKPQGVGVTLAAFVIVIAVALLFPSPKITNITADADTLTVKAGETAEISFSYESPKAKTDKLVWGSEQPEVAVIQMDSFSAGRVNCTVKGLTPGEAVVHLGTGLDLKATVAVTVTE